MTFRADPAIFQFSAAPARAAIREDI